MPKNTNTTAKDDTTVQRRVHLSTDLHGDIMKENIDANKNRSKEDKLNTEQEMIALIEDGLEYRKKK